jgi:hypothetical protein
METSTIKLAFMLTALSCLACGIHGLSELTLLGPTLTPFGTWQEWETCSPGKFITGVDVRSHRFRKDVGTSGTKFDEVGLISAVWQCTDPPGELNNENGQFIFAKVSGVSNSVQPSNFIGPPKLLPPSDKSNRSESGSGKDAEKPRANVDVNYDFPLRNYCKGRLTLKVQPSTVR